MSAQPSSDRQQQPLTGHKAPSTSGANAPQGAPTVTPSGKKKIYKIRGSNFIVDSRYDVIKAIGLGAYGLVCSAYDNATNTYVAIKKVPKLFSDLVDTRRVLREIKCLRLLGGRFPHILELLDVMGPVDPEVEGSIKSAFTDVYMVTDLIDTDLHSVLKSQNKLTFEHHTYISFQIFKGLAATHAAGILHRDLKPGNIFLGNKCTVVLGDYGLARGGMNLREVQGLTDPIKDAAPGIVPMGLEMTDYVVTRWYRSPELLLMTTYDHAVDMWSIGCILAEMMLRRPVFQGRDYLNQLHLLGELVDFPEDAAAVAKMLPRATPEQCRTSVKIGAHQRQKERDELGEEVAKQMTTRLRLFKKYKLDPNGCSRTWNRYMDLVSDLLTFDPTKRLTAREAVLHPYVGHLLKQDADAQLYATDEELTKHVRSRLTNKDLDSFWKFDSLPLEEGTLRDNFWSEMTSHPTVFASVADAGSPDNTAGSSGPGSGPDANEEVGDA